MNADITFGQLVKKLRREMGLTQEELARRVICAPVTLRKIEYDDLIPSVPLADKLAIELNIPLEERLAFVRLARAERVPLVEPARTPAPEPEEIGFEDLSGRFIRGYALGERIGSGGFGVVYRARQLEIDREVAIKIILPKYANEPEFIRHFEAEAEFVVRLEHPHIVPLHDCWREPNLACLVMRLLRAGNLRNLLHRGPLQPEELLFILEQIGPALGAAHRAGVIHRDLKPSNILLDEDHNAYLADFGIATRLSNLLPPHPQLESIVGTPDYISPEQIRSEFIRPQTDIYCLGIMIYELLTGTVPFQGLTPMDIMHQHLTAPLPPLAINRSGLPKALDDVLRRATAKDPFERYENVESLVADFRDAIGRNGRVRTPEATSHIPSPAVPLTAADNPYKGLRAFNQFDAADFFGREALTQQLLARLGEEGDLTRFLAVSGPSGSGKSSVVKAGLIPALKEGALPGSEDWFIVELVPGSNPLQELEVALLKIAVHPSSRLIEKLKKDRRGLLRAVDRCLPDNPAVELVIVIDQFEELFTLVQEEATRTHILDNLVTATLDEHSRVRIVLTLRADFLDRPLNYVDFGELMRQRTEFVLPLTMDELEKAIVSPAERVGLKIEAGVVSAILHDLGDQPGSLPLLQYALTELFEKRQGNTVTKTVYQSVGGVLGALGRRAEDVFTGLDSVSQNAACQLFLRLITLGEGVEDTRRRVLRSELESLAKQETNETGSGLTEVNLVLDAFGKARLLSFDRDPLTRESTVEIAHEALIHKWARLRDWLAESREELRIHRQLTLVSREWANAHQDSGFLATGTRLAQFEAMAAGLELALNEEERAYLYASIAEHQRWESERTAQQRRMLLLQRAFMGVLVVFLVVAVVLWSQARTQARIAFSRQLAAQAFAEVEKPLGNDEYAALLAIRSLKYQYDPVADAALVEAAGKLPIRVFRGHRDEVRKVAYSPDGKYVVTGSTDTTIKLWETATGREVQTFLGPEGEISSLVFSPDGKYILSAGAGTRALLWDVVTGQELHFEGLEGEVWSAIYSPDGKYILTVGNEDKGTLWDAMTGEVVRSIPNLIAPAAFSRDGQYILGAGHEYTVRIFEAATGKEVHILRGLTTWANCVAFSPDGKYALAGSTDNTAILWDATTGEEVYTIRGHSSSVRSVEFSPDGKYILTGSGDRTARLWDLATGQQVRSWRGHMHRVWSVAISPDGKYIVSGSQDGTAKLWDFATGEGRTLRGHTSEIYGTAFSPDGKLVLTSSADFTSKLWDIGTGREIRTFSGHDDLNTSVTFSPDAKYVLTGSEDGTARLWDIATGQGVRIFRGHTDPVTDAVFSPDAKYILTGSGDSTAKLWELATGQEVRSFIGHNDQVMRVAISSDGKYVLTASADTTAKIWDSATAGELQTFEGHTDTVYGAAFSTDGKYILTSSADTTAKLWEVATGKEVRTFSGHTNTVYDIAFSPDGKYALTASADRTAKIWDVSTGAEVRTLSGHTSAIWSAAFSPDGKYVLTGSFDYTARLWEVDYRDFVASVCARLLRDFTEEERIQAHIEDQEPTCY
jgi:WD40 repeat protein/serine/threonine protein kinase/DNA-binding XRE family transcriptional regulator